MFTLTAFLVASLFTILVLEIQGRSLDTSPKRSQVQAWNSFSLQPIAIPVTQHPVIR